MENTSSGWRGKLAGFSLFLSIFSAVWFVIAALGSKFGLWSWQFGLLKMTFAWGPLLVMAAAGIAAIATIIAFLKAPRKKAAMLALGALLVSGLTLGRLMAAGAYAASLPPIHDVQTNWAEPIQPTEALLKARSDGGALNPIESSPTIDASANERWPGFGGRLVSEAQEDAEYDPAKHKSPDEASFPTLKPIMSPLNHAETFAVVREIVKARGWEVITDDPETGRIEAVETSTFFGFKDDVLIRVSMIDGYGRVDVRSVSRVGLSDLGMNAKRAASLLTDIETQLKTAPPA